MKPNEDGFTLMEMLVVLFVIGVILAILLPNLTKTGGVAEEKAEEANAKMLLAQAENYRLAHPNNHYPAKIEDLVTEGFIQSVPRCADKNKAFKIVGGPTDEAITVECR